MMYQLKNIPTSVSYNDEELELVTLLNSKPFDTWNCNCPLDEFPRGTSTARNNLKDKIKRELILIQDNYCAYCGINFFLVTNSKIHRDHVLPKNIERYRKFTFESKNIVLSCDTCNGLDIKKDKDYVTHYSDDYNAIVTSIVHPHLDNVEEHINLDNSIYAEVVNNSSKGRMSIVEFELNCERNLVLRGKLMQRPSIDTAEQQLIDSIISHSRQPR
ncbi:hypothetical protein ACPSLY_06990 [Vibrio parahaemolyticus]|nr:hypothetical protein [Vibrio parahaemolyticus]AYO04203.2 hypothetical protein D0871_07850 [Vibrio parahaemolyticus]EGQ9444905.1 hypothetical protein [Vibrio parahaemolyticus]EHZ2907566.1 hypothetical protein [Vibrio parahaemolyticus]EIO2341837.1 hypothetical protein [Vibrio parahaemolyticus]EJG1577486.1 hypothetical protein [Vibrio parahaemolyticus]